MGNIKLLNKTSIAIVGSRNNSQYGKSITQNITKELTENDIVIISGMAKGIDSIAHKTCLKYGGKTIAVLGSGFKYIYPKENEKLFYDILQNDGLLISEFPLDSPVQMKNFPKRNRIISGLSVGVLVIEAAYRSGTSTTVKHAKIQGKKVFCIPNSIGNKNSYGTIDFIKNGAILVRNAQEILKELGLNIKERNISPNLKTKNTQVKIWDTKSHKIFDCIYKNEIIDSEGISFKTKISISEVNQLVTMLEIEDIIECVEGNKFKLSEDYYEKM